MIIERSLRPIIRRAHERFPIILLTGPRQVGKTTLLQNLQEDRASISLDDLETKLTAQENPREFIERLGQRPVMIDEVQYAPDLFPYIKMAVDESRQSGQFWLTGSQQFSMMKKVSESMAGRVGIFNLHGISLAEEEERPRTPSFVPTKEILDHRRDIARVVSSEEIFRKICRGSFPKVVDDARNKPGAQQQTLPQIKQSVPSAMPEDVLDWARFYASYITTYVERDVREYSDIKDVLGFWKFLKVAAACTGQQLNYRRIAKNVKVSEPTIESWVSILQATGLIFLLYPYSASQSASTRKAPKLYFMDTGLCCYLTRWFQPELLADSNMAGAMLETYVVGEIIKSFCFNGLQDPPIYFYRDSEQREVDLLIEMNGQLHPVEIKKSASMRGSHFKGFDFLEKQGLPIGHGCVLNFSPSLLPLNKKIDLVPIGYL